MPETSANSANYEEIRGHLDIIKAKLAKPTDPDVRATLAEDLEDYYERALQLRVMQNVTQTEELKDQTAKFRWLLWYTQRGGVLLLGVCAVAVIMAAEHAYPGSLVAVAADPISITVCSHVAVAVAVAAVTLLCARA